MPSCETVIERYTLPEMGEVWSEANRLEAWKRVEVHALEAWETLGIVPEGLAATVAAAPCPTPEAVAEREKVTNHDLAAFVDLLSESAGGEATAWVHYGLTSSDVIDTAGGAILAQSCHRLIPALERLLEVVKDMAVEHRRTFMIGRTHGVWAEPTTFGLKLASWCFELHRDLERLAAARAVVAVGKVSGAVGTYSHVPPHVEEHVCRRMGLEVEPASTQITGRDRHAQYLTTLAVVGGTVERIATEIRHLQRSEVAEVREGFKQGQKGSSAMPHKRNPILAERLSGMARLLRGYAQVGLEDMALWHERDISHSSAERVALPDASICLHYMLVRLTDLMENLVVDGERMKSNLEGTNGLVFSQAVLLGLVGTGMSRDQAYRVVQRHAMDAWAGKGHLRDLVAADPELDLPGGVLDSWFTMDRVEIGIATVFERLDGLS
ncbi:MAG: adenylosuccinate lyase [Actinobacteria bacterium]|nr:adenylosuccinate lyase [Actinomycetota bacterium]